MDHGTKIEPSANMRDISSRVSSLLYDAADVIGVEPDDREDWERTDAIISRVKRLARRIDRGVVIVSTTQKSLDRE